MVNPVTVRIAITLGLAGVRVAANNGGDLNIAANALARFMGRLTDPSEDPAALSADMTTDPEGDVWLVTDYAAPLETRKLQVRFQRTPPGGVIEDVDVITMHFLKVVGVTPTDAWVDADYTALEGYLDTWWNALRGSYMTTIALGQYRWYASGSAWDVTPAPYNPARRITERNVTGTAAAAAGLPPQCAMSVTQRTSTRPTWGRFYLPSPASSVVAAEGLIASATCDAIAAATVTLFNAARAASKIPVVFTRARGAYTRHDGTVLPAKEASAHSVESIQVDNLFDVIRSRRWDTTTYRKTTALT